jgi:HK97 family phage portal protein
MSYFTLLNLEPPKIKADFESGAPTGISLQDIESMDQFLVGLHTHSGQTVTPARAMRASAVLACLRILSEDLSALPLKVYKRLPGDDYTEAVDHPLYRLLDCAPNDIMTSMELREHLILDMCTSGNFYVLKNEDPITNELSSLWPLQAMYVSRQWRETIWNFTDPLTGVTGTFTPETVWRGTILSGNGLDGQAITMLAREAIGLLLAAEEQAARLFAHGVQSDLTLETAEALDDEARGQLKKSFMERYAGSRNSWLPLLLENGVKAERIGLTAQESQYLEAREFQVSDVARVFRMPEVLLGGGGKNSKGSTFASAEQFFMSYVKHTLMPWAVRIEQTCNRDLLTSKEQKKYFIKHDFTALLRGDTAARYAAYSTGIASGFLSPADARKGEHLPTVAGLDYFTRPLNTAQAAGGDAKAAPTDESAQGLPLRVAQVIFHKEHKALVGGKQDADLFYSHFGGFIEDLTGAGVDRVITYLEMRRTTAERFSEESRAKAISSLISLCKKDK